jgi:glycosyltransferase involved in cell wall biosynthesis
VAASAEGDTEAPRPAVAVLLPFYGDEADAHAAMRALERLRLRAGDELLIADNTEAGVVRGVPMPSQARRIEVSVKRSAYAARNVAAEEAHAPWLLFLDADCVPPPDLLDRYFRPAPTDRCGACAGEVVGDPQQSSVVARYVHSRGHLSQKAGRRHPYKPMAVTANLLVLREAWEAVGGFQEGTRSGADAEFCWRLQEAGWSLDLRPEAALTHRHRDRLVPLLRQSVRDGAGAAWLERRRPGSGARPPLARELIRALAGTPAWMLLGRPQRALYKAVDAVWVVAANVGYLTGNAPTDTREPRTGAVSIVDVHPRAEAAWIADLAGRVEAASRPERPFWRAARHTPTAFAEDDGILRCALDFVWLVTRHPLRAAADRRSGPHRDPLFAIAPAVGRLARSAADELLAGPEAEDSARAQRLGRLAGVRVVCPPQSTNVR